MKIIDPEFAIFGPPGLVSLALVLGGDGWEYGMGFPCGNLLDCFPMMLERILPKSPWDEACHEHRDVELMGLSPKELGITMRSKVFKDFCDQPHDEEVVKVHP